MITFFYRYMRPLIEAGKLYIALPPLFLLKDGKEEISEIRSIEFRNVSFKYPRTENYILKNVSFKISNKEKVSLVVESKT